MKDLATTLAHNIQQQLNGFVPKAALILGSGQGELIAQIKIKFRISYKECPGLFVSTVPGHQGEFVFGFLEEVPVVCMNGRIHPYEGATAEHILTPIRMLKHWGCEMVTLINSCGALHKSWHPGTLVVLKDQINFTGMSCLRGPNDESYGPRFVSMEGAFDPDVRALFQKTAKELKMPLKEGVYMGVMGPAYETPAEIKMYAQLGGDVVGMSTIHEVIAARHAGLKVASICLITNLGAGLSRLNVSHQEVLDVARLSRQKLQLLLQQVFKNIKGSLKN